MATAAPVDDRRTSEHIDRIHRPDRSRQIAPGRGKSHLEAYAELGWNPSPIRPRTACICEMHSICAVDRPCQLRIALHRVSRAHEARQRLARGCEAAMVPAVCMTGLMLAPGTGTRNQRKNRRCGQRIPTIRQHRLLCHWRASARLNPQSGSRQRSTAGRF